MLLKDLIPKHMGGIRACVNNRAFKYYLNADDLQSYVNEKLAIAIQKDMGTFEDEKQFWAMVHRLIRNAAVDIIRRPMVFNSFQKYMPLHEIEEFTKVFVSQEDRQLKEFTKNLVESIRADIEHPQFLKIFDEFFVNNLSVKEVSDKTGINGNTVRATVFRIRKMVNEKYSSAYAEIMR